MIIIKAGMTWQPKYVMVRESDNPTQVCVVGVITHILYVGNNSGVPISYTTPW